MEAPRLPSFFKSKGPRSFKYRPWFYDPAKEEREKRNAMIRSGQSGERLKKDGFEMHLHEKWRSSNSHVRQRNKSNFRLLLIVVLLLWISYYLLS